MSNSSEAWHTQTRRITRSVIVNRELALWGTLSLLENRYLWPFMVIYIINTHMVIVYMVQYITLQSEQNSNLGLTRGKWKNSHTHKQTWCVWHHSILVNDYGSVMCWPLSNSKVSIDPADNIDLLFKVDWLMTYWSCRKCWLDAYYWWQLVERPFLKLLMISLVTVIGVIIEGSWSWQEFY